MKVLVIGSGGREHAIVWKLSQSEKVEKIFCVPGNAGIAQIATCADIDPGDFKELVRFGKKNGIELTVVGPEAPICAGIADYFMANGLKIFAPTKKAAQLEASKVYAKCFMKKYNIPTAEFKVFADPKEAKEYVKSVGGNVVIKADGLCAGKGVFVCDTKEQAEVAIQKIMIEKIFGSAGEKIVVEERLKGVEVSAIAFCDGKTVVPLILSQDHKPVFDGDRGPNTGGMGAYAPATMFLNSPDDLEQIFANFLDGIKQEGLDYSGVIYAGLMLTDTGAKVLEFNVRFGDPETQAILPLLKTDFLELLKATVFAKLKNITVEWSAEYCVCVVLASSGYPQSYEKDKEIFGLERVKEAIVFHAGTRLQNGRYFTAGGRVLGVCAKAKTLDSAITKVYREIENIKFSGQHYRKDIGEKGLKKLKDCRGFTLRRNNEV